MRGKNKLVAVLVSGLVAVGMVAMANDFEQLSVGQLTLNGTQVVANASEINALHGGTTNAGSMIVGGTLTCSNVIERAGGSFVGLTASGGSLTSATNTTPVFLSALTAGSASNAAPLSLPAGVTTTNGILWIPCVIGGSNAWLGARY